MLLSYAVDFAGLVLVSLLVSQSSGLINKPAYSSGCVDVITEQTKQQLEDLQRRAFKIILATYSTTKHFVQATFHV